MVDYFTGTNGVFDSIKAAGLKLTVSSHGKQYNLETVQRADNTVIFNNNFSKFSSNCSSYGSGVYWKNNNVAFDIAVIEAAVGSESISKRRLAVIIYNVSGGVSMKLTMVTARVNDDQVFVTNNEFEVTKQPDYFDEYVTALDNTMRGFRQSAATEFGCTAIDECATLTHTCPDTSTCKDNTACFECECEPGYVQNPNTSDFVCININECLDGTNKCDINADCTDTMGSYECTCHDGFAYRRRMLWCQ